jgi:hypothetical protein
MGLDDGKIHDHFEQDHTELKEARTPEEYQAILRQIKRDNLFIIPGPDRLGDDQWIRRTWGRPPKLASQIADSEIEKKR